MDKDMMQTHSACTTDPLLRPVLLLLRLSNHSRTAYKQFAVRTVADSTLTLAVIFETQDIRFYREVNKSMLLISSCQLWILSASVVHEHAERAAVI